MSAAGGVVRDWHDSAYLACCRQRAAELRETGACITPLVAPDNRHVDPVVARNCRSAGRDASRDRYEALYAGHGRRGDR